MILILPILKADAVVILITNNKKGFWYLYSTVAGNADLQNITI